MPFCSSTGRMAHDEQARRARQHHADLPASRAPNRSRTPGQYLRQNWLSTGSEWSSQSISSLVRRRPPEAGEAKPLFADLGELPFGFRRLRPGELEKMRCGNQTAIRPVATSVTATLSLAVTLPRSLLGGRLAPLSDEGLDYAKPPSRGWQRRHAHQLPRHDAWLLRGRRHAGCCATRSRNGRRCAKRSRQSSRVRAEYRPTGLEKWQHCKAR